LIAGSRLGVSTGGGMPWDDAPATTDKVNPMSARPINVEAKFISSALVPKAEPASKSIVVAAQAFDAKATSTVVDYCNTPRRLTR